MKRYPSIRKRLYYSPTRLLFYGLNENISAVFTRPSRRISGKQRDHLDLSFLQIFSKEEKHPRTHFCPWKYCEIVFFDALNGPMTVRRGCAIKSSRQGTLKDRVFHFKKMCLWRIYRVRPPGCSCSSRWPCYLNIFNAAKTSSLPQGNFFHWCSWYTSRLCGFHAKMISVCCLGNGLRAHFCHGKHLPPG